ncbi:MAG: electron transfer flavoprotein subunit alpha/FixB family protein [Cyclobacteriaceae bacterium]|nr:electron transfer flavoprotein subunit alpha/FixB family protein [Cyclobacteriaceae bacterium]
MSSIYVIVEHFKGSVEDITFEMLGKAKELGDVTAVLIGNKALASDLGAAAKVITVDAPELSEFNPEAYLKTVNEVVSNGDADMVMVGNTSMGMDIAAGLSVAQNIPLVAYASQMQADSVTSQLYGGKVNVESAVSGKCVVSVLPGSFPADAGRADGAPAVEEMAAPDFSGVKVKFRKLIEPEGGDVDITTQDVLVSAGRGIQSDENIPLVEELAAKLGGAVSCSRPIVDNKWLGKTRQVGKSGLKVKPKLYLTLGISGAPEHIEGMKEADLIIAVNTDPNAPIFDYAHYGCTADLFDLIPALSSKL